jgi:nitrogen fixation NifU-like protein
MSTNDSPTGRPLLRTLEEVDDQYSQVVVDHWMRPRQRRAMASPDGHARITGSCRETIEVFVRIDGDTVVDASFLTDGCIASVAAASMAVELARGQALVDARSITDDDIVTALDGLPADHHHCALLAATALAAAIDDALDGARARRPPRGRLQPSRSKRRSARRVRQRSLSSHPARAPGKASKAGT